MKRFISAMPSSMCWPLGENSQVKVEGIFSRRKTSAISSRAKSPRRLTQPPRFVETVTSGAVVTIRSASASRDVGEDGTESLLRRGARGHAQGQRGGNGHPPRRKAPATLLDERHLREERRHVGPIDRQ